MLQNTQKIYMRQKLEILKKSTKNATPIKFWNTLKLSLLFQIPTVTTQFYPAYHMLWTYFTSEICFACLFSLECIPFFDFGFMGHVSHFPFYSSKILKCTKIFETEQNWVPAEPFIQSEHFNNVTFVLQRFWKFELFNGRSPLTLLFV